MKNEHWQYFARRPLARDYESEGWHQAFHGTWWYGLWNILLTGYASASEDEAKGHEFNKLGQGVYCSPRMETALWYARPQVLFADGVYHRCVLELRVRASDRMSRKKEGGEQWVFPPDAVRVVGFWVCYNCGNEKGHEHLGTWEPELEAVPAHGQKVGCC